MHHRVSNRTSLAVRSLALAALAIVTAPAAGQTIHAVTETTPYTFMKGERVEGTAVSVVEKTLQAAGLT